MQYTNVIISQPWGGLGDNLQYSTLPQLFSELGYNVYISKSNAYRNPEIYELVWKLNPYIKGILDELENAGACRGMYNITDQFIKNIELMHGLTNGKTVYPLIYYTPKKILELENTVIYDITSISSTYSDEFVYSEFSKIFKEYPNSSKKKITFKNIVNRALPDFQTELIEIDDIFQYCDIIYSCKAYVSLLSGGSVLASAIKQYNSTPDIHCIHHSYPKAFRFDNATYHF